jgi:uncharacterized protein (TIGR02246 family)
MSDLEQAIRTTFERFREAWDAHDARAMAECWQDDGAAVDPWGRHAHGRAGVEHLLADEHRETMAGSRYRVLSIDVRPRTEDIVVVDCEAVIDDVRAPNGRAYALPHRVAAVLRLDGGTWRFVSLHPTFETPPHRA